MCDLKVRQCIISGNVSEILETRNRGSKVYLKVWGYIDGVRVVRDSVLIIVNGDIGDLRPNDPIAFKGYLAPDKFVDGAVCLMARAEDMFVPEEW